ncbi:hypothetical protein WOLCODRAFT_99699 [Wolfiporia cocos MD-104 SS10]|uniref:Uncharacterized protein n=1 Tax=Wolfiporia cocos (strain MD-104) TaxID=742152 RepID=A0A2H3JM99_WOLCO|nr:hypothetical protein WOLCODRAFT_99699 [Wolfiporia cocos MD-104 SS10]
MVMQCVEIVSPLKRAKAGSPTPRRPRRDTTDVSTAQAGPSSSSPDRRSTRAGTSILAATSATSPSPDRNSSDVDAPNRLISPPASPGPLQFPLTPAASPSKRKPAPQVSPSRRTQTLHPDLHLALHAQQRAILRSLRDVPQIDEIELAVEEEDGGPSTNAVAYEQLSDLLTGTVMRGEGNSCLLIGPRGSSKTRLVEQAISTLPEQPITIRLSGYAQQNDRLAIREIARQLTLQTGSSFLPLEDDKADGVQEDAENPFLDAPDASVSIALPAPSHLLALISMIPTLPRATVIVLDAFDQFAMHARQSLLYCLLDTAQSCRVGKGNNGLAVIGVTTRVDTINLLEKRVKSRFSGRMLRAACPGQVQYWQALTRAVFTASRNDQPDDEFDALWNASVDEFLANDTVDEAFRETYALTRDVHTLRRILTSVVLELSPAHPFPSPSIFASAARTQRCPPRFAFLSTLPYPAICLLIAAMHAQTSGHDVFTFEMLHEAFRDQVRTSQSAPVQVDGGGIGMVRCTREVLIGAFETLVSLRVFVTTVPPSTNTAREFMLHRCAVERADVKKAVDAMGQTNLKKWLNKMQ